MKKTPPWLIPFLKKIKNHPAAHLGSLEVILLYTYIRAYKIARTELNTEPFGEGEEDLLSDFSKWLDEKFGKVNGTWYTHIEGQDNSKKNVETFFKLFDQFIKETSKYSEHF